MKKIILLFLNLILLIGLLGCNSKNIEKYDIHDFEFNISINRVEGQTDENIIIKVSLKNISGSDIKIRMIHTDFKKIEDMILIGIFKPNEEHNFILNSKGGNRKKFVFRQNQVIEKEIIFKIEENCIYEILGSCGFNYGSNYAETIQLKTNIIKIYSEGKQ